MRFSGGVNWRRMLSGKPTWGEYPRRGLEGTTSGEEAGDKEDDLRGGDAGSGCESPGILIG